MKTIGLLSMFAALSVASFAQDAPKFIYPASTQIKRERSEEEEDEYWLRKGLKKFTYNNTVIWARDKKNADRKARNKGLIK